MSARHACRRLRRGGFTLIEVIGALLIFSAGILMVLRITASLSRQMDRAAITSELVVRTQEWLDSLDATPFDSLGPAVRADTLVIRGRPYVRSAKVTAVTALLYRIDVDMAPESGGEPAYAAISYSSAR